MSELFVNVESSTLPDLEEQGTHLEVSPIP